MATSTTTPASQAISQQQRGWPDFQLFFGATSGFDYDWPTRAIRTGYESYYATRANKNDRNATDYQLVESVTFRVPCNSASTVRADFQSFRTQREVVDPEVAVGDVNVYTQATYRGTWRINRISVSDQGKTCNVVVSIQKKGDWEDELGNTVAT